MICMDNQIVNFYQDFIIVVNSENLYSSICDAVNLIHLFEDMFICNNIFVISNNNLCSTTIKNKVKNLELIDPKIEYMTSQTLLDDLESLIKLLKNNFFLTLSSHGYANQDKNYIYWNGKKITDQNFHDILTNNMNNQLHCLSLIDTCQSGTMLNLNYQTKDTLIYKPENLSNSDLNIICIGAVDDNEYDQDDISNFGYGGGLTSAFIDFMTDSTSTKKTIRTFFIYYKNRISLLNHHPVLSLNNK